MQSSVQKTLMHPVIATNTDGNCEVVYKSPLWCLKKKKAQVKSQNKESHFSRSHTTDKQVKQRQTGRMSGKNSLQTITTSNIYNLVEIVFCVNLTVCSSAAVPLSLNLVKHLYNSGSQVQESPYQLVFSALSKLLAYLLSHLVNSSLSTKLRPNQNRPSTHFGPQTHQLRHAAPLEGVSSCMVSSQIIGVYLNLSD